MTTTEELTGRALDAAVAEEVMGHKWFTFMDVSVLVTGWEIEECERPALSYREGRHAAPDFDRKRLTRGQPVPHYSTSIADAWLVVEKVFERTESWTLVSPSRGKYVAYEATGCADPDFGDYWAYGDTAPEAICRAALAAVRS